MELWVIAITVALGATTWGLLRLIDALRGPP